jgi:hypothetical protein
VCKKMLRDKGVSAEFSDAVEADDVIGTYLS